MKFSSSSASSRRRGETNQLTVGLLDPTRDLISDSYDEDSNEAHPQSQGNNQRQNHHHQQQQQHQQQHQQRQRQRQRSRQAAAHSRRGATCCCSSRSKAWEANSNSTQQGRRSRKVGTGALRLTLFQLLPKPSMLNAVAGVSFLVLHTFEKVSLKLLSTGSRGCRFVCLELLLICHAFTWGVLVTVRWAVLRHRRLHPATVDDIGTTTAAVRALPKCSVLCLSLPPLFKTSILVIYTGSVPAVLSVTLLSLFGPAQLFAQSCCMRQGRLRSWQSIGAVLVLAGIVVSAFTLCGGIGCPAVDPLSVFGTAMVLLAVVCELVGGLARIELLKAQRVDVVKLNAWTALFQLLIGLLFVPVFAILEMQIEDVSMGYGNGTAGPGLSAFNQTAFNDFMWRGLNGFFTDGLDGANDTLSAFMAAGPSSAISPAWSWGGREYRDSRVLLLFYFVASMLAVAAEYASLWVQGQRRARHTRKGNIAAMRWNSLAKICAAVSVPAAAVLMTSLSPLATLLGEPATLSYQAYAASGSIAVCCGLLLVWLVMPAMAFRLPSTERQFEANPRIAGPVSSTSSAVSNDNQQQLGPSATGGQGRVAEETIL